MFVLMEEDSCVLEKDGGYRLMVVGYKLYFLSFMGNLVHLRKSNGNI